MQFIKELNKVTCTVFNKTNLIYVDSYRYRFEIITLNRSTRCA